MLDSEETELQEAAEKLNIISKTGTRDEWIQKIIKCKLYLGLTA